MRNRLSLVVASLLLATAANAQQGVTDKEILLGQVEALTGPPALLGVAVSVGIKMAIAETNAAGGIEGRQLRLISEDDGYVAARAVQGVRKLIEVDKVFAIASASASHGLAALPVLEKAGIPTMATTAPITKFYEPPRKNVFVVGQSYEAGLTGLADYLAKKFPGKKWGIITQNDDYGEALKAGFAESVKKNKLNVVYQAEYTKGQKDFSSEMLALRSSGAEIFIAGGIISENGAMMRELEKLDSKPIVGIFWPGRVSVTYKLMGPVGDGSYAVDYVEADESAAVKTFMERAKKILPEAEYKAINRYTLTGYGSTRVLIEAMKRCGKNLTWDCTIAELEKTKNLETGVMGPVSFGPGVRFSSQKVTIMQTDLANLTSKPVQ